MLLEWGPQARMCLCVLARVHTGVAAAAEGLGASSTQRLGQVQEELEGAVRSAEAAAKEQQVGACSTCVCVCAHAHAAREQQVDVCPVCARPVCLKVGACSTCVCVCACVCVYVCQL